MAVHRSGFRPLLVNEILKYACATLEANGAKPRGDEERIPLPGEPWPLVDGDVQELDLAYLHDEVDLLAGGPPCQPFSLGGIAKGDEDGRNMFPQMFRAVRQIQPKVVLCENVQGLLRPSFRPYFDYIVRELILPFEQRAQGATWQEHDKILAARIDDFKGDPKKRYQVVVTRVNAADYGVPQIRNRIMIAAFRADLAADLDLFRESVQPTHSESSLVHSIVSGSYWDRHSEVPRYVRKLAIDALPKNLPKKEGSLPWRTFRDALRGIDGDPPLPAIPWDRLDRQDYRLGGFRDHVGWPNARIYNGHTPNLLDRPAKTVKAGVHGVPGGESVMLTDDRYADPNAPSGWTYKHRYMTVRETARVMTFPDNWILQGPRGEKMRQLGNAVPVLLGEVFANAIAKVLDAAEGRVRL